MDAVLAIATILGGIAAVWYFWEKIVDLVHPKRATHTPSEAHPIAPGPAATPTEKWVDFGFPRDSGLIAKLEAEGFTVAWCPDRRLARKTELEGWQVVAAADDENRTFVLRLRDGQDNQTLIRRARQE